MTILGGTLRSGNIYLELNKFEAAIQHYRQTLLFTPNLSERAWTNAAIARAYARLGRYSEAIEHVNKALSFDRNVPAFYEILASVSVAQGNLEDTFHQLRKASDLRTRLGLEETADPNPYYYLGVTYSIKIIKGKDEKDFDEALKFLKRAVELRPKDALYYQALGIAYQTHLDSDKALENFEKAISFHPNDALSYLNIGRVYSELKNNDEVALNRFNKAIEVSPDLAEAPGSAQLYRRRKRC